MLGQILRRWLGGCVEWVRSSVPASFNQGHFGPGTDLRYLDMHLIRLLCTVGGCIPHIRNLGQQCGFVFLTRHIYRL